MQPVYGIPAMTNSKISKCGIIKSDDCLCERFQKQTFLLFTLFWGLLPVNQLVACYPHSRQNEVGTIALWSQARAEPTQCCSWCLCLQMKAQCEAKHSVVIESLNHNATMWVCMLWCTLWSVMGCASPVVRSLSLLGMSRTCPCFHDCGIHTCPSFQISTSPLTTSAHTLSLSSIWRSPMPGGFKTQYHLWWLMKSVFNSLMSWCIPSFPFYCESWFLNSKPYVMLVCITIMLNECHLMIL